MFDRDVVSDPKPLILGDEEVARFADMGRAIEAIEAVFRARASGRFVAPPRHVVSFPEFGNQVYTAGGMTGDTAFAGFRVYNNFDKKDLVDDQIVAVWNMRSARLEGMVLSRHVGSIRTGAIGGAAIKHMARADAAILAVLGAGRQASTQVEAAARVRPIEEIRCFTRTPESRAKFADEMQEKLGIQAQAAGSAESAVDGADIVILATSAKSPVIEATWLKPGAHINMLGSRARGQSEIGIDVAERAGLIATDSPEQVASFRPEHFLIGTPEYSRLVDIAEIVIGRNPGRRSADEISLFCSVGLAGTEVMIAAALIDAARQPDSHRARSKP